MHMHMHMQQGRLLFPIKEMMYYLQKTKVLRWKLFGFDSKTMGLINVFTELHVNELNIKENKRVGPF